MKALARSLLLLFLCLPLLLTAETEQSVFPDINRPYLDPALDVSEWVGRFETESREVFLHRHAVVDALNLQAGMAVADIGAGTGLFVPLFAEQVGPDGRVFAVDIAPKFASHIRDVAQAAELPQVTVVLGQERSVTLPHGSIHLAFLCDVYHHFEYPQTVLESIHAALRPGGEMVLIEFERIPGTSPDWVMQHVRAGRETFIAEIEQAGFTLLGEVPMEGFEQNYMLRFRRN